MKKSKQVNINVAFYQKLSIFDVQINILEYSKF